MALTQEEVELRERVAKLEATQEAHNSLLVDLKKKVDALWWKMGVVIGLISAVGGNASEIVAVLVG